MVRIPDSQACATGIPADIPNAKSIAPMEAKALSFGIQYTLIHEVIQEKDKPIFGFLAGSMPDAANLENMQEASGNHIMLKCLKIVFSNKSIMLTSGKSPISWKEQVLAIDILMEDSQSMLACTKYNEVFKSHNTGGYPQGIQMKFTG
jgi:hypothetical protein